MAENLSAGHSAAESRPLSEGAHTHSTTGNGNATPVPNVAGTTGATTSVVEPPYAPGHAEGGGAARAGRTGGELFVVGTFVLGIIGWLTMLVAQAYVAANFAGEPVRILWFGFVIQTILAFIVFEVIIGSATYDAAYAYGTQISILAALATVFAVIGVDRTIYDANSALQATGAGWLIIAIVDLLWIIYFTSPPQSPVARLAAVLPGRRTRGGGAAHGKEGTYGNVEKIGRSTDAFAMSPRNAGSHQRVLSGTESNAGGGSQRRLPEVGGGQRQWSAYTPQTGTNPRGTVASGASEPGPQGLGSEGAASERPESDAPETEGGQPTVTEAESIVKWRAEALFDYHGSTDDPNELVFKKGEILLITDKSGKWWEAKSRDGRKGIAPSNYLRLL